VMNTKAHLMVGNPDAARVSGNPNVAAENIQSEPYESSQCSFVDQVCEFLERYAIEGGSGQKSCSPRHRQEPIPRKSPA
jgi:hypothetical protein